MRLAAKWEYLGATVRSSCPSNLDTIVGLIPTKTMWLADIYLRKADHLKSTSAGMGLINGMGNFYPILLRVKQFTKIT